MLLGILLNWIKAIDFILCNVIFNFYFICIYIFKQKSLINISQTPLLKVKERREQNIFNEVYKQKINFTPRRIRGCQKFQG